MRLASLEIHKEEFSFSAGHFTIFSATEREQLHGHNYYVSVEFSLEINHNGLAFDYRLYKKKIKSLCEKLDRQFLLPSLSPYLKLEENKDYLLGHYNKTVIPFLKSDVVILPLTNITIEELSYWFLQQITTDKVALSKDGIKGILIKVFNGPGQSGGAKWGSFI